MFDLPSQRSRGTRETSKAGSKTEVWVRSDSQAAFLGGGESIPAAKLGRRELEISPISCWVARQASPPQDCLSSGRLSLPSAILLPAPAQLFANCAEGITCLLGAAEPLRKCFCLCSSARFPMLLGTGSQLSCLLVCLY